MRLALVLLLATGLGISTKDSRYVPAPEPSRADSLEAGLVDPPTFTDEECVQEYKRAISLWLKHKQFLDEIIGRAPIPVPWT